MSPARRVQFSKPLRIFCKWACGIVGASWLVACVSLEQAAPSISATWPPQTAVSGGLRSQVALGRQIYVTRCAKCHAPEPVQAYSLAEWVPIMDEMADETGLAPSETDAVWAYIRTVWAYPTVPQ